MPLCYGGGVRNVEQTKKIFGLGVEKVAISSAAVENPALVSESARCVGNQSVVVVMDVKKRALFGKYDVYTHNGRKHTGKNLFEFAKQLESLGVGEIVVNSIDHDGLMKGYDLALVEKMREAISVPLTVLGGAGSLQDIGELIRKHGIIGAAAGSLFVFKGMYRAVLINYPNWTEKDELIHKYYHVS